MTHSPSLPLTLTAGPVRPFSLSRWELPSTSYLCSPVDITKFIRDERCCLVHHMQGNRVRGRVWGKSHAALRDIAMCCSARGATVAPQNERALSV